MCNLSLGFSPCPNDTFMFYGMLKGKVGSGRYSFNAFVEDIETLNRMALSGKLDITKASVHLAAWTMKDYVILHTGAALGRGCGPLVVVHPALKDKPLESLNIAIPGRYTTAALLLGLYNKDAYCKAKEMTFHKIMPAIKEGRIEAGVIIHEGRFVYKNYGLELIVDLGQWWENFSSLPLPLGCILAKRSLAYDILKEIENLIRESILLARKGCEGLKEFIRFYAQELDDATIEKHIETYVNEYSLNLGTEGEEAIRKLFIEGYKAKILPEIPEDILLS